MELQNTYRIIFLYNFRNIYTHCTIYKYYSNYILTSCDAMSTISRHDFKIQQSCYFLLQIQFTNMFVPVKHHIWGFQGPFKTATIKYNRFVWYVLGYKSSRVTKREYGKSWWITLLAVKLGSGEVPGSLLDQASLLWGCKGWVAARGPTCDMGTWYDHVKASAWVFNVQINNTSLWMHMAVVLLLFY